MNKSRAALITLAAGIVLSSAARVFVISKTDMRSGVILDGNEVLCNILYLGAVFLTAFVCAVIRIKDCDADVTGYSGRSSLLIGFGLLIAAVGIGYEGLAERSSLTPSAFIMFADFFFAALLCVIAFITLYMKEFKPGLGFVYVFGGLYCVLRGVFCFMERMVVTAVPEYFIDCLMAILSAMLFLALARVLSGNTGKLTKAALFGWGSATVVTVFSACIGAAIAKFFMSPDISERVVFSSANAEYYYQSLHGWDAYQLSFPSTADIGIGVFALMSVIAICLGKNTQTVEQAEQIGETEQDNQ